MDERHSKNKEFFPPELNLVAQAKKVCRYSSDQLEELVLQFGKLCWFIVI